MNKNKLSTNAVEDWYGTCAIAMCKAAMTYDPDRNVKFGTVAYVYMNNAMKETLAKHSKEEMCLSLDYYYDDSECYLQDCIVNNSDEIGELEFYAIFDKNYSQLTNRQKQIIDTCINDDGSFEDIAKMLGITKQRVGQVHKSFLDNLYSDLYGKRGQKVIEDKRYLDEQYDDYISDEELEEDYNAYYGFIEEMCQCGYASEEDFWDTNL